uniref:HDC19649 n=1 Tax=Drosophila melanogaster TaxID=7227 RepID=Q6II60_DROME|nr:TPA_inf: HDC19649 [Drosophila melanogaster]
MACWLPAWLAVRLQWAVGCCAEGGQDEGTLAEGAGPTGRARNAGCGCGCGCGCECECGCLDRSVSEVSLWNV